MTPSQIIVLATPVFLALIALEFAWGIRRERSGRGRNSYRINDAISSIGLGMLSQMSAVFMGLLRIGVYSAVHASLSLVPPAAAQAFWNTPPGWLLALLFYDFCYYWLHRFGHRSAILWAAHVVHHQSQDYNLSTALRQTATGPLLGWIFYLPMALAGVPPLVFVTVGLVDLLYQFWVHTEQVGRLGWFDRWFCSPSNHRVHHAVNDRYVDRNYGGILIVWDRLFGTFVDEDDREPCVYGTRKPLDSWDPLWANLQVYRDLVRDSLRTRRWSDKLRVWLKPPGWQPADLAAIDPQPRFDLGCVERFDPPMSAGLRRFAAIQFTLLLGGVALFLWFADLRPPGQSMVSFVALVAVLWALNRVIEGRTTITRCLAIQAAAMAIGGLAYAALGSIG